MNKPKATQIKVAINFENKLRDIVMYLIDKVEWPNFYLELSKFANILKKLKDDEPTINAILNRWAKREQELSILCIEVVGLSEVSKIENVFD